MDYRFNAGSVPLLVSMPHVGTDIPDDIAAGMAPCAQARADTDWHLEQLYGFAQELGASTLAARWSRYVIDLNRPPDDAPMYPGASNTELCPSRFFDGDPLYREVAPMVIDTGGQPVHQLVNHIEQKLKQSSEA